MRIVCISDTQGAHWRIPCDQLPEADMLIHAGDITCHGLIEEVCSFDNWIGILPYKHKIVIAGNHDKCLGDTFGLGKTLITNAFYLENEGVELKGFKIWGTPVNLVDGNWAFNKDIEKQVSAIPQDTNILIAHSPPYGILDKVTNELSCGKPVDSIGSLELLSKVEGLSDLKLNVFGHAHASYGINGIYINAAMQDDFGRMFKENNILIHEPILIEI